MPVVSGKKKAIDVSNNLFFDTCAYDMHFLAAAISQRGVHRMAFGTEVPGTSSDVMHPILKKPVDDVLAILKSLDFLDSNDIQAMTYHNPLRMFPRLEGARQRWEGDHHCPARFVEQDSTDALKVTPRSRPLSWVS